MIQSEHHYIGESKAWDLIRRLHDAHAERMKPWPVCLRVRLRADGRWAMSMDATGSDGATLKDAFLKLCENLAKAIPAPSPALTARKPDPKRQEAFIDAIAAIYADAGGNWAKP